MDTVNRTGQDIVDSAEGDAFSPTEDRLERLFRWAAEATVIMLMILIGVELVARGVFSWSMQITTELGGYALVVISFLSLSTGLVNHSYHRVHFVEKRLSPRGRAYLHLIFDGLSFAGTIILVWQCLRFELITWHSGDVAPTNLTTPFWMPRLFLVIGFSGLAVSLLRTLAGDLRRLRSISNL